MYMAPKTLTWKISCSFEGVWERVFVGGVMPVPALLTSQRLVCIHVKKMKDDRRWKMTEEEEVG